MQRLLSTHSPKPSSPSKTLASASLRPQDDGLAHVYIEHTLLGDYLHEDELHTAVGAVLRTANSWDDELQQKFGSKRVSDL